MSMIHIVTKPQQHKASFSTCRLTDLLFIQQEPLKLEDFTTYTFVWLDVKIVVTFADQLETSPDRRRQSPISTPSLTRTVSQFVGQGLSRLENSHTCFKETHSKWGLAQYLKGLRQYVCCHFPTQRNKADVNFFRLAFSFLDCICILHSAFCFPRCNSSSCVLRRPRRACGRFYWPDMGF